VDENRCVDTWTLRWFIIFPLSSAAGIDLLAYLVVKLWQHPPEEAPVLLGHALVGAALSVPYCLVGLWAMRRYRAEHIRVLRMTYIERVANVVGCLKLSWPCLVFIAVLAVARGAVGIAYDLPPRLLDGLLGRVAYGGWHVAYGGLLLWNLVAWGLPIAAGEMTRNRREALGAAPGSSDLPSSEGCREENGEESAP
jgi:hypothetical protein